MLSNIFGHPSFTFYVDKRPVDDADFDCFAARPETIGGEAILSSVDRLPVDVSGIYLDNVVVPAEVTDDQIHVIVDGSTAFQFDVVTGSEALAGRLAS